MGVGAAEWNLLGPTPFVRHKYLNRSPSLRPSASRYLTAAINLNAPPLMVGCSPLHLFPSGGHRYIEPDAFLGFPTSVVLDDITEETSEIAEDPNNNLNGTIGWMEDAVLPGAAVDEDGLPLPGPATPRNRARNPARKRGDGRRCPVGAAEDKESQIVQSLRRKSLAVFSLDRSDEDTPREPEPQSGGWKLRRAFSQEELLRRASAPLITSTNGPLLSAVHPPVMATVDATADLAVPAEKPPTPPPRRTYRESQPAVGVVAQLAPVVGRLLQPHGGRIMRQVCC